MLDRAAPSTKRRRTVTLLADGCHVFLSVMLWLGGNVLVALGLVLAIAILAADAQPAMFFAHLDNLASHYLFASADRREAFDRQLLSFLVAVLALLLLARLPGLVTRLRRELARGGGDD